MGAGAVRKPAQLDKEGMVRLLAELNEERVWLGVTGGASPRVGAAAAMVAKAAAAARRRPRPLWRRERRCDHV